MKQLIVFALVFALVGVLGAQSVFAESGGGDGDPGDPQPRVYCLFGVSLPGAGIARNETSNRLVGVHGEKWFGFEEGYRRIYSDISPGQSSQDVGICDADAINYDDGNPDLWAYKGPRGPNDWPSIGPGTTTCRDPAPWLTHYAIVCG